MQGALKKQHFILVIFAMLFLYFSSAAAIPFLGKKDQKACDKITDEYRIASYIQDRDLFICTTNFMRTIEWHFALFQRYPDLLVNISEYFEVFEINPPPYVRNLNDKLYGSHDYFFQKRIQILKKLLEDPILADDFTNHPELVKIVVSIFDGNDFIYEFFTEVYPKWRELIISNIDLIIALIDKLHFQEACRKFFKELLSAELQRAFSKYPRDILEMFEAEDLILGPYELISYFRYAFPHIEESFLREGYNGKTKEYWDAICATRAAEKFKRDYQSIAQFFEYTISDIKEAPELFQTLGQAVVCHKYSVDDDTKCTNGTGNVYRLIKKYAWDRREEFMRIAVELSNVRENMQKYEKEKGELLVFNEEFAIPKILEEFLTFFGEQFQEEGLSESVMKYWDSFLTMSAYYDGRVKLGPIIEEFKAKPDDLVEMSRDSHENFDTLMFWGYFDFFREEFREFGYAGKFKEYWLAFVELEEGARFDASDFRLIVDSFKRDPQKFIEAAKSFEKKTDERIDNNFDKFVEHFEVFEQWSIENPEEFWNFVMKANPDIFDKTNLRLIKERPHLMQREKFRKILKRISRKKDGIRDMLELTCYFYDMDYFDDKVEYLVFDAAPIYHKKKEGSFLREKFYEKLFFGLFGRDYTSTDSVIGGIDTTKLAIPFSIDPGKNLKEFNYKNIDAYDNLFSMIQSVFSSYEKDMIEQMDYSSIYEEVADASDAEKLAIITEFENRVSIYIGGKLFEQMFTNVGSKVLDVLVDYYRKDKDAIDVTQHNFSEVLSSISLMQKAVKYKVPLNMNGRLAKTFQGITADDFETDEAILAFIIGKLDVEEISFIHLHDTADLAYLIELQDLVERYKNEEAARYLANNFEDLDIVSLVLEDDEDSAELSSIYFDLQAVESIRTTVNARVDRITGDKVVIEIGARFIRKGVTYDSLENFLRFANIWIEPQNIISGWYGGDVLGIYQLVGNFAYNKIVHFFRAKLEENGEEGLRNDLLGFGHNYDELVAFLENKGYLVKEDNGNIAKAVTRVHKFPRYVVTKGFQTLFGNGTEIKGQEKLSVEDVNWETHHGVEVKSVKHRGKEIAKMIKCKRDLIGLTMLMNKEGRVNMGKAEEKLGSQIIFSAPVSMTTGNHKLKEVGIKDGKVYNWLISFQGRDGFIISDQEGNVKILNKNKLKLSDLVEGEEETEIKMMEYLEDYAFFFDVMKQEELSLLSEMLLIEDGEMESVSKDGPKFRRFFVEYEDEDIGIIDSSEAMTTQTLIEISKAVRVKNAVYMDTGMYDMATYYEPNGRRRIMGHEDTDESTNRIVLYVK